MEKSRMVDATLAIHDGKHGKLCELCDLAEEVRELREGIGLTEDDVRVAAGELMVEMPEPGSPMARVMVANALIRKERNEANEEVSRLRARDDNNCALEFAERIGELVAENHQLRAGAEARRVAHERLAELVSTLQEELAEQQAYTGKIADRCAELSAKLARVESWYARTTTSDGDELCAAMDELGNTILRDPQPSAAPTPKKGEPYNGW